MRGRVVLVGAGHAHLEVARRARRLVARGAEVVLVDPGRFWYSGLATGMLGGTVDAAADQVDAASLIERHGGRYVRDRLVGLDPAGRRAQLASGVQLGYDVLSLNLGSEVPVEELPGAASCGWSVKPVSNLWRLRLHLEERFAAGGGPVRAVVAGGGASGCEVAANLIRLARRRDADLQLTLISRSRRLLERQRPEVSSRVARLFSERGIRVALGCRVAEACPDAVVCSDGRRTEADLVVVATGLRPPGVISDLGLARGEAGGLLVDHTLRSVDDPRVLAVGDCADLRDHPLPRLGVFAVRQAPVLLHNLEGLLGGGRLRSFRPQRRWLSILDLGDDGGLALWGGLWFLGRFALRLKNRIDRRFLARYRLQRK